MELNEILIYCNLMFNAETKTFVDSLHYVTYVTIGNSFIMIVYKKDYTTLKNIICYNKKDLADWGQISLKELENMVYDTRRTHNLLQT